jgi:ribosomal protein S14
MEETDKICRVCFREIHGMDMPDEQEMCTICNEVPVMPGKVFCSICFREMNGEKVDDLETPSEDDEDEPIHSGAETVSTMDEIVPDLTDSDIPEPELREIDKDLSLLNEVKLPQGHYQRSKGYGIDHSAPPMISKFRGPHNSKSSHHGEQNQN